MKFSLTIDMDNDAFSDEPGMELSDILAKVRKQAYNIITQEDTVHTQSVMDSNGNRVGGWKVVDND